MLATTRCTQPISHSLTLTDYFLGSNSCSVAEVSFDNVISDYLCARFKELMRLYLLQNAKFYTVKTCHPHVGVLACYYSSTLQRSDLCNPVSLLITRLPRKRNN